METLTKKQQERLERLAPNGTPRYVRCYDNGGETMDRYTIVYTGNYANKSMRCEYFGCSSEPFHGIGLHDGSDTPIDVPTYSHLGKKVKFETLPPNVKLAVMQGYVENWNLPNSLLEKGYN